MFCLLKIGMVVNGGGIGVGVNGGVVFIWVFWGWV